MRTRALGFALCCSVLCSSAQTRAQDGNASNAVRDSGGDERAHKLFEAGRAAYDVGSYREALNYFQQAYDLSGRPRLLYNIGQCADRLRMDDAALEAFQRYLRENPDADNRLQIQERIRVLEEVAKAKQESERAAAREAPPEALAPAAVAAAAPQSAEPKSAAPVQSDETPAWYGRWYVWAGVGGAVAAAVVVAIVATSSQQPASRHVPNSGVTVQALRVAP